MYLVYILSKYIEYLMNLKNKHFFISETRGSNEFYLNA